MTPAHERERRMVLAAAGALGFSCVITQLALMRDLLGTFAGNEMVLGVVLGLWLLLMGLGTWLGRASDNLRQPLTVFVSLQILVSVLPPLQVFLLRALRNVLFVRGAAVGVVETVACALVLLLPYCLAAGYALTLACSLLARGDAAREIGHVYVADAIGSIAGGILFSFVFVRFLDHIGMLIYPALVNLFMAGRLGLHTGGRRLPAIAVALALGMMTATILFELDAISTGLQYPHQRIVTRANSPYGRLLVTESDGQFDFIENGVPLTSTRDDQHVEETVHYPMAQRPDARNVLLLGGGISGTAKEILKWGVQETDYVEIDPLLLELGRKYLPDNLADDRIRTINTDGRLFIKQAGKKYDVVIIDLPDPSTAQLNRFYTVEFMAEVKRTLAPHGVMSFALGHYENYVSPELARLLASAYRSLKQSFRNVLVIPGGRVFFLASDGPLFDDIATRIEQQGIKTKLVNRHYLEAMLTADRRGDMQRAIAQPAELNTDFSPVLYYYHLRHWMSQFTIGFRGLQVALLILLGVYLVRLRGAALVVFASGYAGTALEIVLLLAFQVLCGSVYHQVGVIVTVFIAGLAMGAAWANRLTTIRSGGVMECCEKPDLAPAPLSHHSITPTANYLAFLALAIAGFAFLLPLLLPLLNRMGGNTGSLFAVKAAIASLTFVLALLVGMQFPLATQLEFDGTVAAASRLYTADFVGACLGALLACTLLIPLVGVTGVCLLTAGLNLLGGAMIRFRKAST
jgi:spermidine synthase